MKFGLLPEMWLGLESLLLTVVAPYRMKPALPYFLFFVWIASQVLYDIIKNYTVRCASTISLAINTATYDIQYNTLITC